MHVSDPDIAPSDWHAADPVELLTTRLGERYADHPDADVLRDRLDEHLPTFWEAFSAVYGDGPEAAEWAIRAVDAAIEGYENRDDELRAVDRERARNPDWFQRPDHVA
ncbi:MAG: amylosucrase, partial [Halorhabdus sp.]